METEPISVRIARLRGCEPRLSDSGWWCDCQPNRRHGTKLSNDTFMGMIPDYLTAAASFALLAEMVEGPFQDDEEPIDGADVAIGKHGKLGYWFAANDGLNNQKASQLAYVSRVPTLGEAIALAYEAYATAKAVRQ